MPLPAGYKAQKAERPDYDPIPEGIYQVEIAEINEKQKPKFRNPEETETVLDFEFVILDEGEAKARRLWKNVRPYVVGGDKPSHLFTIFTKALHRPELTEDEAAELEVGTLIGKQVMVMVDRKPGKDGKVYNNITAFSPAKTTLDPVEKSEPRPKPKATEDRETTIKAIFATARKLYPTLAAAPQPKEELKKRVAEDFKLTVASWSTAPVELLNQVYRALKNIQAEAVTAGLKPDPSVTADGVNIDDIPF